MEIECGFQIYDVNKCHCNDNFLFALQHPDQLFTSSMPKSLVTFISIIIVNIEALNDIWLVGNKDVAHALQDLKWKAIAANKSIPYI